jgi:hypothetical protein
VNHRAYRLQCPKCRTVTKFTVSELDRRETAIAEQEAALRQREELLSLREAEHQQDVRLIRSCLHPDKHGGDARYTKAWQAFDRLLDSSRQPHPAANDWTEDIPF